MCLNVVDVFVVRFGLIFFAYTLSGISRFVGFRKFVWILQVSAPPVFWKRNSESKSLAFGQNTSRYEFEPAITKYIAYIFEINRMRCVVTTRLCHRLCGTICQSLQIEHQFKFRFLEKKIVHCWIRCSTIYKLNRSYRIIHFELCIKHIRYFSCVTFYTENNQIF